MKLFYVNMAVTQFISYMTKLIKYTFIWTLYIELGTWKTGSTKRIIFGAGSYISISRNLYTIDNGRETKYENSNRNHAMFSIMVNASFNQNNSNATNTNAYECKYNINVFLCYFLSKTLEMFLFLPMYQIKQQIPIFVSQELLISWNRKEIYKIKFLL